MQNFCKNITGFYFSIEFNLIFYRKMDAEAKPWSKTCKAAVQLRKDLVDNLINPDNYKPSNVQQTRPDLYGKYPKTKFASNFRNIVTQFKVVAPLGEEAISHWMPEGKLPTRVDATEGKHKSNFILL